jgi:hypothetical protein
LKIALSASGTIFHACDMQVAHDNSPDKGENALATMKARGLLALLALGLIACEGMQDGLDSDVEGVARNVGEVALPPGMSPCGIWPIKYSQFRIYSNDNLTGQCLRGQLGVWAGFLTDYTWPNGVSLDKTIRSFSVGSTSSGGCHVFRVYRDLSWISDRGIWPASPVETWACSHQLVNVNVWFWPISSFRSDDY